MSLSNQVVSVLYAQTGGCYFGVEKVDPWDIERDAKLYDLDNRVLAHPPCQKWGKMARVNYARWGGAHNLPEKDGGCFASAFSNVNRCGGILEHPAQTYAWKKFGLKKPERGRWVKSGKGWTCEVWQSAYGHRANKATWLYYVGKRAPFDLDWERKKGSHQIGFQDQRGKVRNKPTLSKVEANATPLAFRDLLLELVRY